MMKKIRCPRCGVINLEKFVTYPHCAGCGSMLPQSSEATDNLPVWRRPLGPVLWVTVIAGAVVGLVVAATMFEKAPAELGRVIVYGRAARTIKVDSNLVINLTFDVFNNLPTQNNEMLQDVRLRLSRGTLDKFEFISLSPPPDNFLRVGTGRYFQYHTLPRDTLLQLTLRPRQLGTHSISVGVYARDHQPALPYNVTVRVLPTIKQPQKSAKTSSPPYSINSHNEIKLANRLHHELSSQLNELDRIT